MTPPSRTLLKAVQSITGTGNFHSTGTTHFFLPGLEVEQFGEVSFPLPESQAKALIAMAERAPFGQGTRTVHDENVRKCWQLDASQFRIQAKAWSKYLKEILQSIAEDLGIGGKISAVPYKLLIYGKGGHFKAHRDTEKLDAMFGTLIIALPSKHEGGKLFIRHDGKEAEVDFSSPERRGNFQHVALFADCEHEVETVRSGYRCCLVYNLRLDEGNAETLNLPVSAQAKSLLPPLARLKADRPGKLSAVLLEHSYTEANLSLRTLKGHDLARARALMAAAVEAGFTAYLALFTFHQSGQLEEEDDYYRYGRRSRGRYHEDAPVSKGAMGEIFEESWTLGAWRDKNNRRVELGEFQIDKEDLISDEDFNRAEPDEEESEGYTGNAGCTMDHWYRRAAIVLWASADHERILCDHDFSGATGMLVELADTGPTGPDSRFQRLALAIVDSYPDMLRHSELGSWRTDFKDSPLYKLLAALAKAKADEILQRLLSRLPPEALSVADEKLWSRLLASFGEEIFGKLLRALTAAKDNTHRRTLYQMLGAFAGKKNAAPRIEAIVTRLLKMGIRQADQRYAANVSSPAVNADPLEARILLSASPFVTTLKLRQDLLVLLQDDGSLHHIRGVLGPALLAVPASRFQSPSLAPELTAFAIATLDAELQRPIKPYPDWKRPFPAKWEESSSSWGSFRPNAGRPLIAELAAFMADPQAKDHHFARPEGERSSLEGFITKHSLDLDVTTLRIGRPYTLHCVKNNRSHHRALQQREHDEQLRGKLRKLGKS